MFTGCSDNPDSQAAKEVRKETFEALEKSKQDRNYEEAQKEVTLFSNKAEGLTRDGALLAVGALALNRGIQEQSDLGFLALPVRSGISELEKLLRRSEELMMEKSSIEKLLASGEKEKADLQKLLESGTDYTPALNPLLADAHSAMDKLMAEKDELDLELQQVQETLDDFQKKADDLLRQAELAKAEQKLTLQQAGYEVLKQRKSYDIQAQDIENKMGVLDSQMELVQGQLDNLSQSIQQIQTRIDEISQSESRQNMAVQGREIEAALAANQQQMTDVAQSVSANLNAYNEKVDAILTIYEEASGELQKIRSGDADFVGLVRRAEIAHQSALASAAQIGLQTEVNERLVDLLQTTEPTLASVVQDKLPIGPQDAARTQKTMDFFGTAFENYQQAYEAAGRLGQDAQVAQCSLLKSHMLAISQKMRLADRIGDFDLANQTETALNELIRKGAELGTSFTQSEAMRVIQNEGLNYMPELPLNMEVLAEGLRQRFTAWKRLPINEQEQAVDANLKEIEDLISKYGQDLATHLEPLKQEMVSAKERGFKEPVPGAEAAPGEPNSVF